MEHNETHIPSIGDKAPEFCALSTRGEVRFPQDYHGKWVILFNWQADFSPVCSTEIMVLGAMANEFREMNTQLIGLSADSINSHIAWLRKIRELAWKDMKHIEITFPLISDTTMEIAGRYGIFRPGITASELAGAVFILDTEGIIRAILYYPAVAGRNISEIKRLLSAIQKSDQDKVATPANWFPEEDVLLIPPRTYQDAQGRVEAVTDSTYCLDWFLCFKQMEQSSDKPVKEPESNPYPSANPVRHRQVSRRQIY